MSPTSTAYPLPPPTGDGHLTSIGRRSFLQFPLPEGYLCKPDEAPGGTPSAPQQNSTIHLVNTTCFALHFHRDTPTSGTVRVLCFPDFFLPWGTDGHRFRFYGGWTPNSFFPFLLRPSSFSSPGKNLHFSPS